ncbi:hypothetical protein KA005_62455, partial [bacterium]|nr:hypothetical protein [bacterium]
MGIVHRGPPIELISKLKETFCIATFVETGTYQGDTAYWASGVFDHVITIEVSKSLYEEVVEKYGHTKNVEFMHGDSREKLKGIIAKLDGPSIFWLDAHWSGGTTYGENDPCPLIEEIKIINSSEYEHFVLIDDARLFTSPPPDPHPIEQWPNICVVISALSSSDKVRYIVIFEDVIIAVPNLARDLVAQYCQNRNIKSWKEHGIVPDDRKQLGRNEDCKVEKVVRAVTELVPNFIEAKDLLKQLGGISEQEVGPGIDQPENNCAKVTIKNVDILKGVRIYCDAPVYDEVGFDNSDSQTNGENALLPFLIKQGDIVFDVGANKGEWSMQVLSAVGSVQIHSFEPVPDTFALLKQVL